MATDDNNPTWETELVKKLSAAEAAKARAADAGSSTERTVSALQAEVKSLREELFAARDSHASQIVLHDELKDKLSALQELYDTSQRQQAVKANDVDIAVYSAWELKETVARLYEELAMKELHMREAERAHEQSQAKAAAAIRALETTKRTLTDALDEETKKSSEAAGRAAEAMASSAAASAEVARLDAMCERLARGEEAEAETKRLTDALRRLQHDHAETEGVCESMRAQLAHVASAAERANLLNEQRVDEAEAALAVAEAQVKEWRERSVRLSAEVTATKEELNAKTEEAIEARRVRDTALCEVDDLRFRPPPLQSVIETKKIDATMAKEREKQLVVEKQLIERAERAENREREVRAKLVNIQFTLKKLKAANASLEARLTRGIVEDGKLQEESNQLLVEAKTRGEDLERTSAQMQTLEEALSDARRKFQEEQASREAAEARITALEERLSSDNQASKTATAAIDAMDRLRVESEQLLASVRLEVQVQKRATHEARKKLSASESRVAQLEQEVVRLQRHEHALHTVIGRTERIETHRT